MEDADAALARALQEEEFAVRRDQQKGSLLGQLQDCMDKVIKCEDELLQALALSVMPLDELRAESASELALNASLGQSISLSEEDLLVQKLLHWFKYEFFKWTDKAACAACGCLDTILQGTEGPSQEEKQHDASRVEVYRCTACSVLTRFPRYNDPGKLLETRCGRCGEWANCFLLVLRAAGIEARYILDVTDHVWCEYYSTHLSRWMHVDPCEASCDKPLLYEAGWGKKLSYIFAVGTSGFVDVIRRYTRKWDEVRTRRDILPETELVNFLHGLNARIRSGLPQEILNKLQVRDLAEQLELLQCSTEAPDAAALAQLPGRTTGALEWRQGRGETGDVAQDGQAPASSSSSTSYTAVRDAAGLLLNPAFLGFGRIRGGACRASGENAPGEAALRAFDASVATKWLDFGGGGLNGSSWLEYRMLNDSTATLAAYDIVSANDSPERDPCSWVLEGLSAAVMNPATTMPTTPNEPPGWILLDQQSDVYFSSRYELRTFFLDHERWTPCTCLRLRILKTKSPTTANSVQLSCLNLYDAGCLVKAGLDIQRACKAVISNSRIARSTTLQQGNAILDMLVEAAAEELLRKTSELNSSNDSNAGNIVTSKEVESPAQELSTAKAEIDKMAQAWLSTLVRLFTNICSNPGEPKYRKVRAVKLPPGLLAEPSAASLLWVVGFRPLLMVPERPPGGIRVTPQPETVAAEVFIVHSAGEEMLITLRKAAELLGNKLH
ncbi:hypothetical protein CEUSTIGMA_g6118.t1 [Chlamydomonas eustigma]|uniref:Transglutaminase-like domain-containing protein n=1 Tax=Chlamydomonas eustigma TaxID=1157962 RepID=A0A250X7E4_9CHLO|nr:hypothetical protein CEUSTIGMA_g6118.t1 [Chlamydomonas eustigma]|eukprot:GAX78680.1 hypothetical protein CEUSTIGMA_g6118.t1 [Chlamydomonas eustigma]